MKINGNTVGTPTPRTNYNQTNPKKADYLVGRDNIASKDDLASATEEILAEAKASDTVVLTWNGSTTSPTITLPDGLTKEAFAEAIENKSVKLVSSNYNFTLDKVSAFVPDYTIYFSCDTLVDKQRYIATVSTSIRGGGLATATMVVKSEATNTTAKTELDNTFVTQIMVPNRMYCYTASAVTTLRVILGTPTGNSKTEVQEYRFRFTSGSTPTTLSFPDTVIGTFVPEENKTYEVSIIDNYLSYKSWPANLGKE